MKRAIITVCAIAEQTHYLDLIALWVVGIRKSGWSGDILIYTNRVVEVSTIISSVFGENFQVKIEQIKDTDSIADAMRQKVSAALSALETYDEILFTDLDVVVRRDPNIWAFSYPKMMVSQDLSNLFHLDMVGNWYPDLPDRGEPGANAGIWSLARSHIKNSLLPWYGEMSWRLETDRWPRALHDQSQLNKLWFEGKIDMGLFPITKIDYPHVSNWPRNEGDVCAVHYCALGHRAIKEMKKALVALT